MVSLVSCLLNVMDQNSSSIMIRLWAIGQDKTFLFKSNIFLFYHGQQLPWTGYLLAIDQCLGRSWGNVFYSDPPFIKLRDLHAKLQKKRDRL
jgi:hypothetical protein